MFGFCSVPQGLAFVGLGLRAIVLEFRVKGLLHLTVRGFRVLGGARAPPHPKPLNPELLHPRFWIDFPGLPEALVFMGAQGYDSSGSSSP